MRIHCTVKKSKIVWAWCCPHCFCACCGGEKQHSQRRSLQGALWGECLAMPCLYLLGIFYLGTDVLGCLLWYISCPDQKKFIFLAKQQWFCSYWCSCLDTRRFCTSFSNQNSAASLLLLCSHFHWMVFWPTQCSSPLLCPQLFIPFTSAQGQIASTESETDLNTCLMLFLSLLRGRTQGVTLPSSACITPLAPQGFQKENDM